MIFSCIPSDLGKKKKVLLRKRERKRPRNVRDTSTEDNELKWKYSMKLESF